MVDYKERIQELEEELKNTKYNKRTQGSIGLLKAKIAKLKEAEQSRGKGKGKTDGYDVRKTGDGTVILIGFPSVGKSTLLNSLTNAESKTAGYAFTTLTVVPGLMEYKHAKIQILDVPGIVKGASDGSGRGKEVLSVARSADLVIIVVDVNHLGHYKAILRELFNTKLRLNQEKPDVRIKKTAKDGIRVGTTVKLSKLTESTIKKILQEFRINNADVLIRTDITDDELIDVIEGNRKYVPAITILNKIDMVPQAQVKQAMKAVDADLAISAKERTHIDTLKDLIFKRLRLIRIYMKEPRKKADLEEPLIMFEGSTIKDVCQKLHRDFVDKFRFARIWGSSKFPGQRMLKLGYTLKDGDILELHIA